ncbi:MAG: hemerythrin domain-containing protein [Vampirovibrionales bacterium]|nr:hemerythrin domain-containing protein [Vampirovibrionales bacterium]
MTPPCLPQTISILDQLRRDHRRCETLIVELRELAPAAQAGDAAALEAFVDGFNALRDTLRLHYLREEQGLFPLLNQYRTMVLLQVEHDDIVALELELAESIETAAAQKSLPASVIEQLARFDERLSCHVREEENGVFTLAESVLEPEEKALAARKCEELLAEDAQGEPLMLERPQPVMQLHRDSLLEAQERPIVYSTAFQEEQASVQRLWLQAGAALTRHWSAQYQYILLVSGAVTMTTDVETLPLTPGQSATISPRFAFSMKAEQDSLLIVTKVWPRPHFRRARR